MNKSRRADLAKAMPLLAEALAKLAEARATISDVRDEERDVYEGMSEGQQSSDQGDAMQNAIAAMESALDGIDQIDLRDAVRSLEETAERDAGFEAPAPSIDAAEADARRHARLPGWAQARIAGLAKEAEDADARLRDVFAAATDDPTEIVVGDYSSPIEGRVIPAKQVTFPAFGITITVARRSRVAGIEITSQNSLTIHPQVSNSIIVSAERMR